MTCLRVSVALACLTCASWTGAEEATRYAGPWNMEALAAPPKFEWGAKQGLTQEIYYESEPRGGKPTRVFAYYGAPADVSAGPHPAMLLVHGGGGKAFQEWAQMWAERGYVCLAMDTAGCGPDGNPLPDGGPDQGGESKIRNFKPDELRDLWTYYAVAAVVRGHSLLASLPHVDPKRVGITGISWGGYLTSIVAGLDARLAVAVPVYGCGFLAEDSVWTDQLAALDAESRTLWIENYDPKMYLPAVTCPILWLNGTNDGAYYLDSYQRSYRLTPLRTLAVRVRMPHSHPDGWAPTEIALFVDSVLQGGKPLAKIGPIEISDGVARATASGEVPLKSAELHFTTGTGPWKDRPWQSQPARLVDGRVEAPLPPERPLVAYLSVTDERGALVSTEYVEIAEE